MGTAEVLAAQTFDVDRVTLHIEPSGTKSLIGIWTETIVTQQVFVSRDPFYVLNGEIFPAVGACGIVE